MQTKITNKTRNELQQLRLNREILYTDLINQIKYLNEKKISLVKAYKYAVDKIQSEIDTISAREKSNDFPRTEKY